MISRAIARFVRVSPRKTRYVLDVIRHKNVDEAFSILDNVQKGAAFYIKQALKSALDNAVKKTNGTADASNLFISRLTADGGPMLKRYKAGSMGRAMPIKRRTAHIVVELDMVASAPVASSKPRAKKQANKVEIKNKTQAKSKIETKNKKAALAR